MRQLDLNQLQQGLPGVTPATGSYLYEAAVVALTLQNHAPGTVLRVSGDFEDAFQLHWNPALPASILKTWKNRNEAAAYGAVGISLLLFLKLTNFTSFEMGQTGTGIDYWLSSQTEPGEDSFFPKREARLEISGILRETPSNPVEVRIGVKKNQIKPTDDTGLPGWVCVVEFSHPKSKIVKK